MTNQERSTPLFFLLATLLVLSSVCALHPQFISHLSTHFLGGAVGDGGLYVWLASTFHADPKAALVFQTNGFYPYPTTRAWSDLFFLPSAIVHLLMIGGLSLETAYNITILTAMALNGAGIATLARALGGSKFASLSSGIAFANCAYLVSNLGHPQLIYLFWIPLCWSLALSTTSSARRWLVVGLSITCAFYCSVYYAVFAATGLAFILALRVVTQQLSVRRFLSGAFFTGIGILPIGYSAPAYLSVKDAFGSRGLHEAEAFSASGLSYLSFSSFHPLLNVTSEWTHGEATLCVGYFLLCIALFSGLSLFKSKPTLAKALFMLSALVVSISSSTIDPSTTSEWITNIAAWVVLLSALWVPIQSPSTRTILFAVIAIFFALSFGPGGNHHKHEPAFAPLSFFYAIVPGFDAIRATARCGAMVIMGLFVVLALVLTSLKRMKALGSTLLSVAVPFIVLAENYIPHPPLDPATKPPLALEGLQSRIAPQEAVLFLPFSNTAERGRIQSWTDFAILNTQYTQWTAPLRIKTVNGYSGQRSKIINELPPLLANFPTGEWSEYVSRICGVAWIIITPEWASRLAQGPLPEGVSLVESYADRSALLKVTKPLSLAAGQTQLLFAPRTSTLKLSLAQPDCPLEVSMQTKQGRSIASEQLLEIPHSNDGSELFVGERVPHSFSPLTMLVKAARCANTLMCAP